jgi:hypothetical protein
MVKINGEITGDPVVESLYSFLIFLMVRQKGRLVELALPTVCKLCLNLRNTYLVKMTKATDHRLVSRPEVRER